MENISNMGYINFLSDLKRGSKAPPYSADFHSTVSLACKYRPKMSKDQEFHNEIDVVMRVMRHAQSAVKSRFIQEVVPNRLTIVQFNALQHLHWYGRGGGYVSE